MSAGHDSHLGPHGPRNRIASHLTPRMTAKQAPRCEPQPSERTVSSQSLQRVVRARRSEPAHRAAPCATRLIGPNGPTRESCCARHLHQRPRRNSAASPSASSLASAVSADFKSCGDQPSRGANTLRRYSPASRRIAPSRASSRNISRTLRRQRFRTTAVPTDLGTANIKRGEPAPCWNLNLSGPRRAISTKPRALNGLPATVELFTRLAGFALCDDVRLLLLGPRGCSSAPESRVFYVAF